MTWTDKGFNLELNKQSEAATIPGVGCVIGRFHIDQPHAGHLHVLNEANKFTNLVILLGCASFPLAKKNPLDFVTRKQMLQTMFPHAIILPIYDKKSDVVWSKQLDSIVRNIFPFSPISVIGSRDSFLGRYSGNFNKILIESPFEIDATSIREKLGSQPIDSPKFRAGVIYASQHIHPRVQPTVDIGIWRKRKTKEGIKREILLGRKKDADKLVLPGGFVDSTDPGLEYAALRETGEETGLKIGCIAPNEFKYLRSSPIKDWRAQPDCTVFSSLFALQWRKPMGEPKAGDDLEEVYWVDIFEAGKYIAQEHVSFLMWVRDYSIGVRQ